MAWPTQPSPVRTHLFHDPLFYFVVVTIQYLDGFSIFLKHQEAALFSPPAPGSPLPTLPKSAQSLNNAEPCVQALFFVGMARLLRNLARATEPHLQPRCGSIKLRRAPRLSGAAAGGVAKEGRNARARLSTPVALDGGIALSHYGTCN